MHAGCVSGDLRLKEIGEMHHMAIYGFIQYCWNGNWSTVCTRSPGSWGAREAAAACKQLGYEQGKI